jgi:putative ABC transport system substrate-binding protein
MKRTWRISRRSVLAGGSALLAMPRIARGQSPARRVGILLPVAAEDPAAGRYVGLIREGLAAGGWTEGPNLIIDIRFTSGLRTLARSEAAALFSAGPIDAVVCLSSPTAEGDSSNVSPRRAATRPALPPSSRRSEASG